jgi:hypothetical protein
MIAMVAISTPFHRREIEEIGFDSLRGQKISVGAEGSGTHRLSLLLARLILEFFSAFNRSFEWLSQR